MFSPSQWWGQSGADEEASTPASLSIHSSQKELLVTVSMLSHI